jgi:hypothetical protein
MPITNAPVYASGTLTSDATNVTANDTVVVGSVTYTFKASVTTTANEVLIGANAAATLSNLKDAINKVTAGSGVTYGSLTVINPDVAATTLSATTLALVSKVPGTVGNFIPTTEASTHLSLGGTVLAGGTNSIWQAIDDILATEQINAEVTQMLKSVDKDSTTN